MIFSEFSMPLGAVQAAPEGPQAAPEDPKTSIEVVSESSTPTIYVDDNSDVAVLKAVENLQQDIDRVTTRTVEPPIVHDELQLNSSTGTKIIVGTIGQSKVIDEMIAADKIDSALLSNIKGAGKWSDKGKWESSIRVVVDGQIVIIGSDPRGTIYGIYDLSEELGVSPWYFWADVTPEKKSSVVIDSSDYVRYEPDVQYRSMYINDEVNLVLWSREIDPEYSIGPETYKLMYELMGRLNLNFLKPASHPYSSVFINPPDLPEGADPLQNIKNADEYAIVIGSPAPMFRNNLGEWPPFAEAWEEEHGYKPEFNYGYEKNREAIEAYWEEMVIALKDYEVVWSLGMRGLSDGAIMTPPGYTNEMKADLVTEVVSKQQEMLAKHINGDTDFTDGYDTEGIFQTFEVYKEVLDIYNAGLKDTLPEEAAIIWSEDNHGNIRQFPNEEEQARSGGNTLYYHLSYYGSPKSYIWLYTTPLSKVGSELDRAYANGIQKAWIFNVGDIKPAELAIDYAVNKAWDVDGLSANKTDEFVNQWMSDVFGTQHGEELADIIETSYQLAIARRPEFLGTNLFDPVNFGDEWTQRMKDYENLYLSVNALYDEAFKGEELDDAFYQLVVYPIRSAYHVNSKWYYTDMYNLYKEQGRGVATNYMASMAVQAQENEYAETEYYNKTMSDGKWDKIMNPYPPNIGLYIPSTPRIPTLTPIAITEETDIGVVVEGTRVAAETQTVEFSSITQDARFIDVFSKGIDTVNWSAQVSAEWINLTKTSGITSSERVWASVDWDKIPGGNQTGTITFTCEETESEIVVNIEAENTRNKADYTGYVEANGYISIEAENFDKKIERSGYEWVTYEDLGRSNHAMMTYPTVGDRITTDIANKAPELQYEINVNAAGEYDITFYRMPTLDGSAVRLAYALNDGEPQIISGDHNVGGDWSKNVLEGIEKLTAKINVPTEGKHTLKVWMVDPAVSFDQIVIETEENVDNSYFAAPESYHSSKNTEPGQQAYSLQLRMDENELLLREATELLKITNLGNSVGQYSKEVYDELAAKKSEMETLMEDLDATDEAKRAMASALIKAMNDFKNSRIMNDDTYTYHFYEDFESRYDTQDLSGMAGTISKMEIEKEGDNAYLSCSRDLSWNIEPQESFLITEYRFKANSGTWTMFPTMYDGPFIKGQRDLPGPSIITKGSGAGAQFQVRNPEINNWQNVTDGYINYNEWYSAKIEVNVSEQKYDFYLNDKLVVDDMGFRSSDVEVISEIIFGGADGLNYQLDDVKIYTYKNPVQSISLDQDTVTMNTGEETTLIATVLPENATNKGVSWTSSNEAVATVSSEGVVTGVSVGKAIITAETNDGGKTDTCEIMVESVEAGYSIEIIGGEASQETGKNGELISIKANVPAGKLFDKWVSNDVEFSDANAQITVFSMPAKAVSITATFKEPTEYNYLIKDDFEARFESQDMTGIDGDATKLSIVKDGEDAVMSAQTQFNYFIEGQDEYLAAKYDFRVMNNTWTSFPTMYDGPFEKDVKDLPAISLVTAGSGSAAKMQVRDPESNSWKDVAGGAINVGEWYSARIEVDVLNQTYDYYLNDVLLVDDIGFRSTGAKLISQINFGGGAAGIDFQLDDLQIYTTEKAPEPEKYSVQISGGTADKATASKDEVVKITAEIPEGKKFVNWTSNDGVTFSDETKAETSFIMPEKAVSIVANYVDKVILVESVELNKTKINFTKAGETVQLQATITPESATNKQVTWKSSDEKIVTVDNAGVVTAIANGTASITVSTEDGNKIATCEVVVNIPKQKQSISVIGGTADKSEAEKGETITISAVVPEGKEFVNWSTSDGVDFTDQNAKKTTFTMPESDVVITANFKEKSSEEDKPNTGDPIVLLKPDIDGTKASATIGDETIKNMLDNLANNGDGQLVKVQIQNTGSNVDEVDIQLSKELVARLLETNTDGIEISTGLATLTIDQATLKTILEKQGDKVSISVKRVDGENLSPEAKERIGNRPMYEFTIESDGTKITNFGDGKIRASIPYKLEDGENPDELTVYYVPSDGSNTLEEMEDSQYVQQSQTIVFSTNHFSKFAVGEKVSTQTGEDKTPQTGEDKTPQTGEDKATQTGTDTVPKTGDDTNFWPVYTMVIAIVAATVVIRKRKKSMK